MSVDGDTAVIGALNKYGYQGAAYVFVQSAGVWSQQGADLTASDGAGLGVGNGSRPLAYAEELAKGAVRRSWRSF